MPTQTSHPPTLAYASPSPAQSVQELEHQIGLKWAGWVGAIVLVIGAGLGIDFAYEQGWFALVPPLARMGILCAFATALLAVGEWVYRKISPLAAVGLYGAGVATLLLTCYAGHAFYGLYGTGVAWALMFAATLIGAGVARRGNLVSIAVLSLVGGYLAPALLPLDSMPVGPFCGYLLALEAIALMLAGWGSSTNHPTKWWTLRGVALAGTAIWIAVQFANGALAGSGAVAPFLLVAAIGFHAEVILSAVRQNRAHPRIGVNFTLLVTVGLTAALLYQFRHDAALMRTAWIAGLAIASAALAWLLSRRPKPALKHLSFGYMIQTGALLAVAVPVALSGIWISFGWAMLALAFAMLARRIDLASARWGAIVCWCLAVADLALWTTSFPLLGNAHREAVIGFVFFGTAIPAYALMSFVLAVVGHAVSQLIEPVGDAAPAKQSPLALGADAIWALAALAALPTSGATAMLLLGAALLLAWAAIGNKKQAAEQGLALLVFATGKWLLFDTFFLRIALGTLSRGVLADSTTLLGLLLAGAWAAVLSTRLREYLSAQWRQAGASCCVLLLLWEGSLAVDRFFGVYDYLFAHPLLAEQVGLSIFWAMFAIGAIAVGFPLRQAPLRYFGLGLFGLTLLKVLMLDLSQVSTGYRVLSFIGLGLLLLGTSVLYGKLSPRLLELTQEDKREMSEHDRLW